METPAAPHGATLGRPRWWVARVVAPFAWGAGLAGLVALASCGSGPVASGAGGATAPATGVPGSTPGSSPGSTPFGGDTSIVPRCQDVPALGPVRDGGKAGGNPPIGLQNVLATYANHHPESFAGSWIDRDHGGTFVMAFTGDPAPRLAELLELRPAPGDDSVVRPAAKADGTTGSLPAEFTADTRVRDSGWTIDVVRATHTSAELQAIADGRIRGVLAELGLRVGSYGVDQTANRVQVTLVDGDGVEVRRRLATRLPADAVCTDHLPTADERWPAGVPKPATMIPAAGSDPWVTCGLFGTPFPASALTSPPALAPDDPLAVAFAAVVKETPGGTFGDPAAYHLLVRTDTAAVFVNGAGATITAVVTLERRGDRWIGRGGGVGGGPCDLRALLPPGLGDVGWTLDGSYPAPGPADTTVHVLLSETACRSGRPIGDRLRGPEVEVRDGQVLVAFAAAEPTDASSFTCPSNPTTPFSFTLPEPLGARTIVDGRGIPPVPVRTGSPRTAIN